MVPANVPLLIMIEHWHVKQWNIGLNGCLYQCWLTTSVPFICISDSQHLPIQFLWYKVGGSKKKGG